MAEIACNRPYERDDSVYVTAQQFERRYGATAEKFSEVQSTVEKPVEVCGIPEELEFLTRLRCDDGSNPYPDGRAAHFSRRGSVGLGGRCGSLIDLYPVPCPEKTYEVYIDVYICPVWERYMAAGEEAREHGNYPEAEKQFAAAVEDAQGFGPDDPRVAASLSGLAYVYQDRSRYGEAEPLYKRALAIREKALGPEHPVVASSLFNLAGLYKAQGRYAEAEPLYKRALAIFEKALGPEHPHVAKGLRGLAILLDAQGNYAEAESLFKRALAIREKALGPDHPFVASSLNDLAGLYKAQGRYAEAEPLYERALAIWENVLGPEHPNVATSLENYAALLRKTGRSAEASRMEARAKTIRAKRAR